MLLSHKSFYLPICQEPFPLPQNSLHTSFQPGTRAIPGKREKNIKKNNIAYRNFLKRKNCNLVHVYFAHSLLFLIVYCVTNLEEVLIVELR